MSAVAGAAARGRAPPPIAMRTVGVVVAILVVVQSLIVVEARPQDLVTGFHGMVDIIRRATPPDFSKLPDVAWPALETVDIAIFGTLAGVAMALPLAVLAATNVTPSRALYYASRATIGFTRAVPDLVWALLFVTAVGLGPFPGGLALAVHSIGMLGRLFAETIENMDMAPIDALALTGANRIQVFTHGVVPSVLPALLGIGLYRLDENIRSSLVLGFVGAGGIGFQLLTAMNLFQYPRGVAAADRDLRHRVRGREAVGGVPGTADLNLASATTASLRLCPPGPRQRAQRTGGEPGSTATRLWQRMTTMLFIPEIVDQHLENAASLWLARDYAVGRSSFRLADLVKLDERLEANIDALRIAEADGWSQSIDALDQGEAGDFFAAAVLALESGDPGRFRPRYRARLRNGGKGTGRTLSHGLRSLARHRFRTRMGRPGACRSYHFAIARHAAPAHTLAWRRRMRCAPHGARGWHRGDARRP